MEEGITLGVQKEKFSVARIDEKERQIFEEEFNKMFYPPWGYERRYMLSRKNDLLKGLMMAKSALDGKRFGGFNAGQNEIGWSPIRPGHVGMCKSVADTAAEGDNKWSWDAVTTAVAYNAGFNNWIHSPHTATTALSIYKYSCIVPLYIIEESAVPKIQTIKMDIGRSDILPIDVRASIIRDSDSGISLIPLPYTFWAPEMDVLIGLQTKASGLIEPRLGGMTFAYGSFLDATTYSGDTDTVTSTNTPAT